MQKSVEAFRTITEVAEWLETPAHVLRFWETRFEEVRPLKRAGGRRYYRPSDMLLLGGIKTLLHDEGMTIKGVQRLLAREGLAHVAALSPPIETAPEGEGPELGRRLARRERRRQARLTGEAEEEATGKPAGAPEVEMAAREAAPQAAPVASFEAATETAPEAFSDAPPEAPAPRKRRKREGGSAGEGQMSLLDFPGPDPDPDAGPVAAAEPEAAPEAAPEPEAAQAPTPPEPQPQAAPAPETEPETPPAPETTPAPRDPAIAEMLGTAEIPAFLRKVRPSERVLRSLDAAEKERVGMLYRRLEALRDRMRQDSAEPR